MTIYTFNEENKIIGGYDNEEMVVEGIQDVIHRDFPTCTTAFSGRIGDDSIYEEDDNLTVEQWTAELVDRIQETGWFVTIRDNVIYIQMPYPLIKNRPRWISFDNWSEVEYWLNEII